MRGLGFPWLVFMNMRIEYVMEKKAVSIMWIMKIFVKEMIEENIIISLKRFKNGGAPPFASNPIDHHKVKGGMRDWIDLFIRRLRVCVFSYKILDREKRRDLVKPWLIFIIIVAKIEP